MFRDIVREYMNINMELCDTHIDILREVTYKKPSTDETFIIVTHTYPGETLRLNGIQFATCQHKIDRIGTYHYWLNNDKFKDGYYI
jgi:hypothetical protein